MDLPQRFSSLLIVLDPFDLCSGELLQSVLDRFSVSGIVIDKLTEGGIAHLMTTFFQEIGVSVEQKSVKHFPLQEAQVCLHMNGSDMFLHHVVLLKHSWHG